MSWPGTLPTVGTAPKLWLRADLGVTGTTQITKWADQSGNGNDVTETSANGPSLNTTGNRLANGPAISFSGTKWLFVASSVADPSTSTGCTIFIVKKETSATSNYPFTIGSATTGISASHNVNAHTERDVVLNSVAVCADANSSQTQNWEYWTITAKAGAITLRVNGSARTITGSGNTAVAPAAATVVGARASAGTSGYVGLIDEIAVYPAVLSAGDINTVEAYILARISQPQLTISESITTPIDSVSRVFVGTRSISESITDPSDAVARVFVGSRAIAESITNPSDAIARAFVGARGIAESVSTPNDAVSRDAVMARAISESVATPSDAVARALIEARAIAESLATPSDAMARHAVVARGVSESVATPSDSVARSTVQARAISESITTPSDSVSQVTGTLVSVSQTLHGVTQSATVTGGEQATVWPGWILGSDLRVTGEHGEGGGRKKRKRRLLQWEIEEQEKQERLKAKKQAKEDAALALASVPPPAPAKPPGTLVWVRQGLRPLSQRSALEALRPQFRAHCGQELRGLSQAAETFHSRVAAVSQCLAGLSQEARTLVSHAELLRRQGIEHEAFVKAQAQTAQALLAELQALRTELDRDRADRRRVLSAAELYMQEMQALVQQSDRSLAERQDALASRDRSLSALQSTLDHHTHLLTLHKQALAERDQRIGVLQVRLDAITVEVPELQQDALDRPLDRQDPVHRVPGGYQWGSSGKVYGAKKKAQRQAAAIFASGWRGDEHRKAARHLAASRKAELQYQLDVARIMGAVHVAAKHIIERELKGHEPGLRQDGPIDDARRRLQLLFDQMKGWLRLHTSRAFDKMASEVKVSTGKGAKLLGIPLASIPGLERFIEEKRRENVALITNASQDFLSRVRGVLDDYQGRVATGESVEGAEGPISIAEALAERVGVSESRARLIAVDQTLKTSSAINRFRQQAAGVRRWRWSSSLDERVRPSHRQLEGHVFSWDDDERRDEMSDFDISDDDPGDPAPVAGTPVNCRCVAIPIIEELEAPEPAEAEEEPDYEVAAE